MSDKSEKHVDDMSSIEQMRYWIDEVEKAEGEFVEKQIAVQILRQMIGLFESNLKLASLLQKRVDELEKRVR